MENVNLVLNGIGWLLLVTSWIVPAIMKKKSGDNVDRHLWGMTLAASSVGFFVSALIISLMK